MVSQMASNTSRMGVPEEGKEIEMTDSNWVVEIQERSKQINLASEAKQWSNQSIYTVPSCVKDLNAKAYRPLLTSFGPYRHGEAHLLPMEDHKQRALLHFLRRTKLPLVEFVRPLERVLPQLMGAYERLDERWREDHGEAFLKVMLVDGCFVLELLRFMTGKGGEYAENDPIFSNHGQLYTVPYIKRDMLMVENQIPLLVLEKLVSVEPGNLDEEDRDINNLILRFCVPTEPPLRMPLGLHTLDVVRKSMIRGTVQKSAKRHHRHRNPSMIGLAGSEIIRSAMELNEAGIIFRPSETTSLRDIHFRHGVLHLPPIVVDDSTESLFLNLMAFERLHVNAGNEVTSYVFFMDNIIDSSKDVSLLASKDIIQNAIGSDKEVAKLFNTMCRDVTLDPDSNLDEVHRRVNKYCRKSWNMWRANLIHTYFRSPWALLSLLAAIFLLGLTVAQTVYTIMPYYNNDSSPTAGGTPSPTMSPS